MPSGCGSPIPNDHIILPEIISKEPLGPAVRHGDDQWFDIVKWALFAMINAEELGITSKNVDEMMKSTNPEVKRFVGTEGNYGEQLGLTKDWAVRIIKLVGNYGEVVRAQCRAGLAAQDRARLEQIVEQGRHPVRAADPLSRRSKTPRASRPAAVRREDVVARRRPDEG